MTSLDRSVFVRLRALALGSLALLAGGAGLGAQTGEAEASSDDGAAALGRGWSQWRGDDRSGRSPDHGLLRRWPEGGPRLLWTARGLGPGFSSVVFSGRRVFTMGDGEDAARLIALDAADGRIEWTLEVGPPGGKRNPGPRATPATDGEVVVGLGHEGTLVCATVAGEARWRVNLVRDLGGRMMSGWGYSESPLLDGGRVVCTPGGPRGAVAALDLASGEVVWRCEELRDPAAYTSLVPVRWGGVRQYVVFTGRSVAGVAAADGRLLWRAERPGRTAVCSDPVCTDDGYVFVSSAYNVGCDVFRVTHEDGAFEVEKVWSGKQLLSHHGGVVLVDGHVYGLGRRELKCIELRSGEVAWRDRSVGKGSITYADGMLVVRSERAEGEIALVRATPDGYDERGRFAPPARSTEPAWAHPVVFGGRLWVRDDDVLSCFEVRR